MWGDSLSARNLKTLRCSLETTQQGSILWISIQRPAAYNALSMEVLEELHYVFRLLEHPTSMLDSLPADFPRVVVLSGAGKAFCGGVDIKVRAIAWGGGRQGLQQTSAHSFRCCPHQCRRRHRHLFSLSVCLQAADQGIGGATWDYHDMRSQQTLSRLIERMRAVPQPIIAAVLSAARANSHREAS